MKKIITYAVLAFYLVGCASNSHRIRTQTSEERTSYDSEEVSLGKQIHEYIVSKMPVYDNAEISKYVRDFGKRLTQFAKRKDLPYQFIILRDDRIYATSAPGGYVYITTGFLSFLNNEAELAAVLAHEVSELQWKDPRLSRTKALMEKMIASSAAVAAVFGNAGALVILSMIGVYAVMDRGSSQEKRLYKADKLALHLVTEAGEDPQGMIDLSERLLNASSQELMYLYDYYQTRPMTEARLKKLEDEFKSLPLGWKTFYTNYRPYLHMTESLRVPVATS